MREDREIPNPRDSSLAAAAENEPPQSPQALPEGAQLVDVTRDCMVAVKTGYNLS